MLLKQMDVGKENEKATDTRLELDKQISTLYKRRCFILSFSSIC